MVTTTHTHGSHRRVSLHNNPVTPKKPAEDLPAYPVSRGLPLKLFLQIQELLATDMIPSIVH